MSKYFWCLWEYTLACENLFLKYNKINIKVNYRLIYMVEVGWLPFDVNVNTHGSHQMIVTIEIVSY